MTYHALWESSGLFVRQAGLATDTDLVELTQLAYGDSRFCDLRYVLLDLLGCTGTRYDVEIVTRVAATNWAASLTNPRIRLAVVATQPQALAMTQVYVDAGFSPFPLRVFSSIEAARQWVGLPWHETERPAAPPLLPPTHGR